MSSDTPTVDFGAHLYVEESMPPSLAESFADGPFATTGTDPATLLARYEEAGIDAAVLSQPYFMGHDDAAATAAANDALLDVVERHDEFYGLAAIPTEAGGEAAAAELERALDAGLHGGALETRSGDVRLPDDELDPVFSVADRAGAPLLVHPALSDSLRSSVLDDDYFLDRIFGREAALAASIAEVIHRGILDRYPDLPFVFHHLGGNIAGMMGRVHLQLDGGRWPGQEKLKPWPEFKRQLEDRVYVDTSGFFGYHAALQTTLSELPSSQVLFGTDYPFEPRTTAELREFVDVVESVASDRDAARIRGGNALDLLAGR